MRGLAEQLEHDELSFREFVALKERLLIGKYIVRNSREVKVGFYRGAIGFGDLAYQVQKELLPRRKAKCAFHWFPLFLAPFYAMVPYYSYYKPPYCLCQELCHSGGLLLTTRAEILKVASNGGQIPTCLVHCGCITLLSVWRIDGNI